MLNKVYAYIRVSTQEQKTDRQFEAVTQYAKQNNLILDDRDIITDKCSGKNFDRKGYTLLVEQLLRDGDTLIIKELDRLGRNYEQIKVEWQNLIRKGINIIVIDTPILNTANKSNLEKSLISNIVFELLAYLGEKERIKIKQRQREGIDIAKTQGRHLGRPVAQYPSEWEKVYKSWKNGEITAKVAMEKLKLKRSTFYKFVNNCEQESA